MISDQYYVGSGGTFNFLQLRIFNLINYLPSVHLT